MVYPTLLPLMRQPRLPVVDWTDTAANLNGLIRFAVSARVPSHFKCSIRTNTKINTLLFFSNIEEEKQFTCNLTLWRLCETIVAVATQTIHVVCTVQLNVTVSIKTVLSIAQKLFYGKFISQVTLKSTQAFCKISRLFGAILTNLHFLNRFSWVSNLAL
jgi:hypothetical protein